MEREKQALSPSAAICSMLSRKALGARSGPGAGCVKLGVCSEVWAQGCTGKGKKKATPSSGPENMGKNYCKEIKNTSPRKLLNAVWGGCRVSGVRDSQNTQSNQVGVGRGFQESFPA